MNPKVFLNEFTAGLLVLIILLSSCSSRTLFKTTPDFADIYIDGQKKGTTPYIYSDKKIVSSSTVVMFRKEGYKDLYTTLKRNEQLDIGALIAGIFFLYPLLWIKKYDPIHYYELERMQGYEQVIPETSFTNYMVGEDDQIRISIDSITRTNSLPDFIKHDIEYINSEAAMFESSQRISGNIVTAYKINYLGLDSDYDYMIVYFNLDQKSETQTINLSNGFSSCQISRSSFGPNNSIWKDAAFGGSKCFPAVFMKNEFGELYQARIYRSESEMVFTGGKMMWNEAAFDFGRLNLDLKILVFYLPKNISPIQLDFYYQYRDKLDDNDKVYNEQINIIIVKPD